MFPSPWIQVAEVGPADLKRRAVASRSCFLALPLPRSHLVSGTKLGPADTPGPTQENHLPIHSVIDPQVPAVCQESEIQTGQGSACPRELVETHHTSQSDSVDKHRGEGEGRGESEGQGGAWERWPAMFRPTAPQEAERHSEETQPPPRRAREPHIARHDRRLRAHTYWRGTEALCRRKVFWECPWGPEKEPGTSLERPTRHSKQRQLSFIEHLLCAGDNNSKRFMCTFFVLCSCPMKP